MTPRFTLTAGGDLCSGVHFSQLILQGVTLTLQGLGGVPCFLVLQLKTARIILGSLQLGLERALGDL
ncbi:MAG: hypothetical protein B7Z23_09875 [Pseudomonadales bacterium 32-61-5]|nr:MAG: hypothetical protein B7Z23_09875 [Pseudomonadales bacterium 32-61-5]